MKLFKVSKLKQETILTKTISGPKYVTYDSSATLKKLKFVKRYYL